MAEPTRPIKICVFCGASDGVGENHVQAARDLAKAMHDIGANLVYGGGTYGIMGELAKTLVSLSGPDSVHGIIPSALLDVERAKHTNGKDLKPGQLVDSAVFGKMTVVKNMHERKRMMKQEVVSGGPGSGFVATSGGFGTLEELLEMITWSQLNIHAKPIAILNIDGLYDGYFKLIDAGISNGFIKAANRNTAVECKTAAEVIDKIRNYKLPEGRMDAQWQEDVE